MINTDTGIHTKVDATRRLSSAYRKFSNSEFELYGWETFMWDGNELVDQYVIVNDAEQVVELHRKIIQDLEGD